MFTLACSPQIMKSSGGMIPDSISESEKRKKTNPGLLYSGSSQPICSAWRFFLAKRKLKMIKAKRIKPLMTCFLINALFSSLLKTNGFVKLHGRYRISSYKTKNAKFLKLSTIVIHILQIAVKEHINIFD